MALIAIILSSNQQTTTVDAMINIPNTPYYDELNILSDKTKENIEDQNQLYSTSKEKPQIAVAVVDSTDGDLNTYATDLFQKWRLGNKSDNNGILILFGYNEGSQNVRIEVGYGLEGALPDSLSKQILLNEKDKLKSKDKTIIDQGLNNVFSAVSVVVDQEYQLTSLQDSGVQNKVNKYRENAKKASSDESGPGIFAIIVMIIIFIIFISRGGGSGGSGGTGFLLGMLLGGSSGNSSGGGFSGGGGGFSGGGGSSGGGGASI
ncbi:TPM domain-containing protein [Holzapfeliella floricola]|uniref:TPM domain-containing protein n=1 Tax=Holzapfeliella floricola TaxID=679249 RepID=UPI0007055A7A|nr:TPM domain-containing protein [Holzapfeliella floricola]